MLKKGISPIISTVLIILLGFVTVSIVLFVGLPAIEKARESAVLNEAMQNMKAIANTIEEVALEGVGSLRSLQIKVTAGNYKVNEKTNSIDFTHFMKSGIVQPGAFLEEGDVILTCGANARAYEEDFDYDGETDLVLENEILRVVILKNGTKTSQVSMNTSKLIKMINLKETNVNVTPSDSLIMLDDYIESSYGFGYSELVKVDDHLARAEAIVHMSTTFVSYDILYTLQSGADFVMVKIQNAYYK